MITHPSQPSAELDEAVQQLKQAAIPAGPSAELRASTALAMSREAGRFDRRHRQRRYAAVAAAGILIVLGAAFFVLTPDTSLTFAQVAQQVEKTMTLQGKHDEPPLFRDMPFYIKGKLERWESDNPLGAGPSILIADRSTEETFTTLPRAKLVYRGRGAQTLTNLYQVIRDVAANPVQELGEQVSDGRRLAGYSASLKQPKANGQTALTPVRVWVDPKTKLPVRVDFMDTVTGKALAALKDLRFDEVIDDALFAMTVPDGYRVEDERGPATPPPLRPPATPELAKRLILRPGVGIADVKLGDPPGKLIALLGEPEERGSHGLDGKEQNFNYRSIGLRFEIGWDPATVPDDPKDWAKLKVEDQTIRMFFVDAARISPRVRDFPGATDRGIRIGTPRKEVEAAYGKPVREDMTSADYGNLGMAVTYGSDGATVSGFLIMKPTNEPIWPDLDELIKATTQHAPDGK